MYEKQEEYEAKIKDSKAAELGFREKEKELRQKDLEMQESMITFSVFLQDNERKKNKAAEKIKQETQLKQEKEDEYSRKKKEYELLQKKSKRIKLKQTALEKYDSFLELVKQDKDEFDEVQDIIDRHKTLTVEDSK